MYVQSFTITLASAWSTLCVLDRQAQRDARKVVRFLTCPQAKATYRACGQLLQIACLVAIACGASTRVFLEGFVAACQAPDSRQAQGDALTTLPAPQTTPEIEDPWTVKLPATPAPEAAAILALPPAPSLLLLPPAKPQRKPRAKKADKPKASRAKTARARKQPA